MQEQRSGVPRNLGSIWCLKISPAGRNDKVLMKLSLLSVDVLAENNTTQESMTIFIKANLR